MNLEQLQVRSEELSNSINANTNQLYVLQGHKNEVDYQIKLIKESGAGAIVSDPEPPVE